MTVMSLLPDSSLTHAACSGKARSDAKPCANGPVKQGYSRLRSISVPSLSSVVRDSLSWAGDTLYPRRDAKWRKLKEEQKETLGVGERKQVMYYDMENVSLFLFTYFILFYFFEWWTKSHVSRLERMKTGRRVPANSIVWREMMRGRKPKNATSIMPLWCGSACSSSKKPGRRGTSVGCCFWCAPP